MFNSETMEETFLDYAGQERLFEYKYYESAVGFTVIAKEKTENGYEFETYAQTDPILGIGDLRHKIRKRLATRYLQNEHGHLHLYHNSAKGHIGAGGVVIDGKFIPFEQFSEMLQTYEGFFFEIGIKELAEE